MPCFVADQKLYGWDMPAEQLREVKRNCLLLSLAALVPTVVCGLLPTGVSRHNWVGFAATAALVALMLEAIASVRFLLVRSHLDYRTFHSIHWMMDYAPLFHAMLMGAALIAGIVSCVRGFTGALDLLALALFILAAIASLVFRKLYRSVPVYYVKEHVS